MRRSSRWVGVLLAAGLAASAAACSNEKPEPKLLEKSNTKPDDKPTTPTTPPTTPEPTPGEEPAPFETTPGEPEQFTFIRHYYELVNQALKTGDTQPMLAVSDPNCLSCQGVADVVAKFHKGGGKREGDYLWKVASINHLAKETYLVEAQIDPHVVYPSTGAKATPLPIDKVVLEYQLKAEGIRGLSSSRGSENDYRSVHCGLFRTPSD